MHVVAQPELLAQAQEQPRRHAFAQHHGEQAERVAVVVARVEPAHAEADVGLLGLLRHEPHALPARLALRPQPRSGRPGRPLPRQGLDEASQRRGVDGAGHGDHGGVRHVLLAVVVADAVAVDARDGGGRTGHVAPDRLVGPQQAVEGERGLLVWRVLDRSQLLEDHAPLALDLRVLQQRVLHGVGEQVERLRGMLRGDLAVVDGQLAVRGGVEQPTKRVDLDRHVARRRPPRRALEAEVLQEVREAGVGVGRLVAGAGVEVDRDGDRARMRHRAGDDAQPAVERHDLGHRRGVADTHRGTFNHHRSRSSRMGTRGPAMVAAHPRRSTHAGSTGALRLQPEHVAVQVGVVLPAREDLVLRDRLADGRAAAVARQDDRLRRERVEPRGDRGDLLL